MNQPQLGYYHSGLGTFVYHDANFGDIGTDLSKALQSGINALVGSAGADAQQLATTAQNAAVSALLDTPTGAAAAKSAQQSAIQAYLAKAQTAVTSNPLTTIAIAGGVAFLIYALLAPAKVKKAAQTVYSYVPMPGLAAAPAQQMMAVPVAGNPRRRRRRR